MRPATSGQGGDHDQAEAKPQEHAQGAGELPATGGAEGAAVGGGSDLARRHARPRSPRAPQCAREPGRRRGSRDTQSTSASEVGVVTPFRVLLWVVLLLRVLGLLGAK